MKAAVATAVLSASVLLGSCGTKDEGGVSGGGSAATTVGTAPATTVGTTAAPTTTTTVAPPTTEAAAPTSVVPPSGPKPTCQEVEAALASMSPADRAALAKAPMLSITRLPGDPTGWRIWAMYDVTGTAPRPDVAVFYDWTPATGLGPPVVVQTFEENALLQNDDVAATIFAGRCTNMTVTVNPQP